MTRRPAALLALAPAALLLTALAGCAGDSGLDPTGPDGDGVCQAGNDCCEEGELVCHGDPDGHMVCTCYKAWTCDDPVDPSKCEQQPADTPDGGAGWTCVVDGAEERCTRPGSEVPEGHGGWSCTADGGQIVCTRPTNTPDGSASWDCGYDQETKTCVKDDGTGSDGGVLPDAGTPPPSDGGGLPPGWTCTKNALGETVCEKEGAGVPPGGLPGGGGSFTCVWKAGMIICEGSSPTPPGGNGWNCEQKPEVGGWRCTRPQGPEDTPSGDGTWRCVSGTALGGIQCTQSPPPVKPGAECTPGQKKWCDGNAYCGWGQVTCGPDGKWKRKLDPQTGKMVLDCWELTDGRRPNTKCACYFFYYNKDCCETADCLVPAGTNGQICPASAGQYCDYCHPEKPECAQGGARCIVTSSNESFCGQDCALTQTCPAGSACQKVTVDGATVWQCVPTDLSCYY